MILKEYQKRAVKDLLSNTAKILNARRDSVQSLVFKAPTGSGKTVMMQEYLKELADLDICDFAVIRVSVNDLARQSKKSFEKSLQGSKLFFSELSDVQDKVLKQNEILFINWESLKQQDKNTKEWKVLAMKDNERNENLPNYLKNTHLQGRSIILVVDECHIALDTPKAQDLIVNFFKPTIQIEVSATPDSKDYVAKVEVPIDDVIKEGMISKGVLINENVEDFKDDELGTDEIIIKAALAKREQLVEKFRNEGSSVSPLVLIQLPSEKKVMEAIDQTKLERVQRILLDQFDISIENQRLAVWLSNDKTNKDLIDIKDSPVKVLIFKQAIATGWDCPRAKVLVMFREIKKVTFEIQTVGRILRMPERKHYSDEILNRAYVFTDLPRHMIGIHESAKDYIKSQYSYRNDDLAYNYQLKSYFKSRIDYQDIGSSFRTFVAQSLVEKVGGVYGEFNREDNKKKLGDLIDINNVDRIDEIVNNGKMDFGTKNVFTEDGINRKVLVSLDDYTKEQVVVESVVKTATQEEFIQMEFEDFARENVKIQFTNVARSYKPIMEALYSSLDHFFFGEGTQRSYYQRLVLNNKEFFIGVLNKAKDTYLPVKKKLLEQKSQSQEQFYSWTVPKMMAFNDFAKQYDYKKCIMTPCILSFDSKLEQEFIENFLEKEDFIVSWFKNGIGSKDYFAVPYEEDGEKHSFYPDFIVILKNGKIGIFDTKSGYTLKEGKAKAKGLMDFIKGNVKQNVVGGIVKQENGIYQINNKWDYDINSSSDFEPIIDVLK